MARNFVVPLQERHHLLQPPSEAHGHLAALLVKQQVVESRDGVEQHRLHWRTEQLDKSRDASGLENGEQALSVVTEVMQSSGGALGGLEVVGVVHGAHQSRHHLRAVHDGVPTRLLLGQLVHHHGRLAHHHLVLVVEQLRQLGDRTRREVSVILVVDEVDDGVLEHL